MNIRKVIWNSKGRTAEVLDKYYEGIGLENCLKIKSVAMDGATTYISSTKKNALNAVIVYDRFHVVAKLNTTVDTVRKIELRKARKENRDDLIDMISCKKRFILFPTSTLLRLQPSKIKVFRFSGALHFNLCL